MADANIRAVITAEDKASPVLQNFSTKTVAMGAAIGVAIGNLASRGFQVLENSIGDAVKRVDTLNAFPKVLKAMGVSSEEAKEATDKLSKSLLGLPTPLQDGAKGVQQFVAAGLKVDKATDVFLAMNNALLASGGNAQDAGIVMDSLTRALSGGSTNATTMQAALSRMPTALQGLERQSGKSAGELYNLFAANPQELVDGLIKLNKEGGGGLASLDAQAREATGGIGTSLENAKTAITRALANIINSLGQANIANAIKTIGNAIAEMILALGVVIKFISDHQPVFFALAGAIGAIATMIFIALLPAIVGATVAFAGLIVAALPFILVGAAIGLVAYEIMKNWDVLKNWFMNFFNWIKNNWGILAGILLGPFASAFRAIASLWNSTVGKLSFHVPSWIPGVGGKGFDVPDIPMLAQGGIVTQPTLAMIGEAGPEAVVPLNKAGGMTPNIVVNIGMYAGSEMEKRKIATQLMRAFNDAQAAKGMA